MVNPCVVPDLCVALTQPDYTRRAFGRQFFLLPLQGLYVPKKPFPSSEGGNI